MSNHLVCRKYMASVVDQRILAEIYIYQMKVCFVSLTEKKQFVQRKLDKDFDHKNLNAAIKHIDGGCIAGLCMSH